MHPFDPYVRPLVDEARRRGIQVSPIPELSAGYAILEHDGQRRFLCQSMTDATGTVALRIALHKAASLRLLDEAGIGVGRFVFTADPAEAVAFAADHPRVVAKPADRSAGEGVRLGLDTPDAVRAGVAAAKAATRDRAGRVLVQEHLDGHDVRLLVVGGARVFAVRRDPPWLEADGERTVRAWIADWNDRLPLREREIRLTRRLADHLASQGLTLDDVPAAGRRVTLGTLGNAHQGGFATDVTDVIAEEARALARAAARCFDAALLGIDVITPDPRRSAGRVIEVNPHAGLTVHHQPTFGTPRDVAGAILDGLFPATAQNGSPGHTHGGRT